MGELAFVIGLVLGFLVGVVLTLVLTLKFSGGEDPQKLARYLLGVFLPAVLGGAVLSAVVNLLKLAELPLSATLPGYIIGLSVPIIAQGIILARELNRIRRLKQHWDQRLKQLPSNEEIVVKEVLQERRKVSVVAREYGVPKADLDAILVKFLRPAPVATAQIVVHYRTALEEVKREVLRRRLDLKQRDDQIAREMDVPAEVVRRIVREALEELCGIDGPY